MSPRDLQGTSASWSMMCEGIEAWTLNLDACADHASAGFGF